MKQLKVFVSSPRKGLEDHRRLLAEQFLRMRATPVQMEFFGSSPNSPLQESLAQLEAADVVVVLLGNSTGTVIPGDSKTFSEVEYEKAVARRKVTFVYVQTRLRSVAEAERGMLGWQKNALRAHAADTFETPEELCRKVAADLFRWRLPQVDWYQKPRLVVGLAVLTVLGWWQSLMSGVSSAWSWVISTSIWGKLVAAVVALGVASLVLTTEGNKVPAQVASTPARDVSLPSSAPPSIGSSNSAPTRPMPTAGPPEVATPLAPSPLQPPTSALRSVVGKAPSGAVQPTMSSRDGAGNRATPEPIPMGAPLTGEWFLTQTESGLFGVIADYNTSCEGRGSAVVYSRTELGSGSGELMTDIPAQDFRGKQLRFSASIRTANVTGGVSLWIRAVRTGKRGPRLTVLESDEVIVGTTACRRVDLVFPLDPGTKVTAGLRLVGTGEAWIDGVRFEIEPKPPIPF